jgi:chaperonin GroEL (HSP60 family)
VVVREVLSRSQRLQSHLDALIQTLRASDDQDAQERLCRRLARLTQGVVEVLVHGVTDDESCYLHDLACSSLHAGRGYIADGGVPAGGHTYIACASHCCQNNSSSQPEQFAAEALFRGLWAPFRCLAQRTGQSPHPSGFGDPPSPSDPICELAGPRLDALLDPARVVQAAITRAGEAAALVLERLADGG